MFSIIHPMFTVESQWKRLKCVLKWATKDVNALAVERTDRSSSFSIFKRVRLFSISIQWVFVFCCGLSALNGSLKQPISIRVINFGSLANCFFKYNWENERK